MMICPEAEPGRRRVRRAADRRPHEARPDAHAAEDVPRQAPPASEGGGPARTRRSPSTRRRRCRSSSTASSRERRRCASSSCRARCGSGFRASGPSRAGSRSACASIAACLRGSAARWIAHSIFAQPSSALRRGKSSRRTSSSSAERSPWVHLRRRGRRRLARGRPLRASPSTASPTCFSSFAMRASSALIPCTRFVSSSSCFRVDFANVSHAVHAGRLAEPAGARPRPRRRASPGDPSVRLAFCHRGVLYRGTPADVTVSPGWGFHDLLTCDGRRRHYCQMEMKAPHGVIGTRPSSSTRLRQRAGIPYEVERKVCSACERVLDERPVRRAAAARLLRAQASSSTTSRSTSPAFPSIFSFARRSNAVGPRLTIATSPPAVTVSHGRPATGCTSSVEPTTSSSRASRASWNARSIDVGVQQLAEHDDARLQTLPHVQRGTVASRRASAAPLHARSACRTRGRRTRGSIRAPRSRRGCRRARAGGRCSA